MSLLTLDLGPEAAAIYKYQLATPRAEWTGKPLPYIQVRLTEKVNHWGHSGRDVKCYFAGYTYELSDDDRQLVEKAAEEYRNENR